MPKELLTTGEVADLCSVTPDAVLKWIKSGKIPATRTLGGHYRVHRNALPSDLIEERVPPQTEYLGRPFQYCWEFHATSGEIPEDCHDCLVYRAKARRCYEMVQLPTEAGHAMRFCVGSCEACAYYEAVKDQRYHVLVVTDRSELRDRLEGDEVDVDYNLAFCDSEYDCSMMVNEYHPDYVVLDCALGEERSLELARDLAEDPRLPFVRVILASERCAFPEECDRRIFARIKPMFTPSELGDLIESLSM